MRRRLACVALIASCGTAAAAQEVVSVIHVLYQIDRFDYDGDPTETLTGEYYFADDGRHRHDRVVEDYQVSEIWIPEREERIALNNTLGLAARGPDDMAFAIPGILRPIRGQQSVRGLARGPDFRPPSGARVIRGEMLDQRRHGPLVLEGLHFTMPPRGRNPEMSYEAWFYTSVDNDRKLIEKVITAATDNGPVDIERMGATSIRRTTVDTSMFAVPDVVTTVDPNPNPGSGSVIRRMVNLWDRVVNRVSRRGRQR